MTKASGCRRKRGCEKKEVGKRGRGKRRISFHRLESPKGPEKRKGSKLRKLGRSGKEPKHPNEKTETIGANQKTGKRKGKTYESSQEIQGPSYRMTWWNSLRVIMAGV